MRTLYISDLDGTLLRSNETLSEFTINTLNEMTEKGMLFSYATARSVVTAKKVTRGLYAHIPLIVYNGTFIIDSASGKILHANYFKKDIIQVYEKLLENEIYPIVYAYIDGVEKFSFIPEKCTPGMKQFIKSRSGDRRLNIVKTKEELVKGNIFYITCIDEPEKLEPFYRLYADQYHIIYDKDIYTGNQWLEIMPKEASKANAAKQLKEMLNCGRIVVFGDGKNDIDMFQIADEAYAVENADAELKKSATGIIDGNNKDGVARWLRANIFQI